MSDLTKCPHCKAVVYIDDLHCNSCLRDMREKPRRDKSICVNCKLPLADPMPQCISHEVRAGRVTVTARQRLRRE